MGRAIYSTIALLAMFCISSKAARIQDLVLGLPDVDRLNADWYSGYIDASPTKHLHYVFVTSLTDPINDPVVIWFNGGPGCSSMLALFQEHGPYVIDDGEYFIKTNPEPWNKRANVLYLESPAGVGFSRAELPSDYQHNDMSQSKDALAAILNWFKYFPEYLRNDLYVSGESYGGIYTPYLAWQLHQHNQLIKVKKAKTKINLKGFLVGNGATQWDVDISPSFPEVVYNFNLIPKSLLDTYNDNNCIAYFNDVHPATNTTICETSWDLINNLTGGLNWYDLFRKVIPNDPFSATALKQSASDEERIRSVLVGDEIKTYKAGYTFEEYAPWIAKQIPKHVLKQSQHPLLGDYLADYANRPDVRKALNIPTHVGPWLECNDTINENYSY